MGKALSGLYVPIVTPLDKNECVDEAAFKQLADFLVEAGVQGFFVGGSAGEGPLLAESQWMRLMEVAMQTAGERITLLAGVQDTSTRRVIEKIKKVEKLGYQHCVVTPPFYIPSKTGPEHIRHFGACVEATSMEVIPYDIPQLTQSTIAPETMADMARRGWARHMKESAGSVAHLTAIVKQAGEYGLRVLVGDELTAADSLRAGAVGICALCSNFTPEHYLSMLSAHALKDDARLDSLQAELTTIVKTIILGGPSWLAAGKLLAARRVGGSWGKPSLPIADVSAEQLRAIDRYLDARITAGADKR